MGSAELVRPAMSTSDDGGASSSQAEAADVLANMITRFNAASERLSDRHDALTAEIESLRERLRVKDEELARAERLSTLGATAAALAHEVRNPLGSIKLFLSLLREDVQSNGSAIKTIDAIDRSVSNLNHVVTNMLQFAADKPCKVTPCNIATVMDDLAQQFHSEHPGLSISVSGERELRVMFDAAALRQIISNLWRNAGQVMRWKGTIETIISSLPNGWSVTVNDTGGGIPESLLGKLFDPFVTGRHEGTGLGLAIVRRLVEQHSGSIAARNEAAGASFELRFLNCDF